MVTSPHELGLTDDKEQEPLSEGRSGVQPSDIFDRLRFQCYVMVLWVSCSSVFSAQWPSQQLASIRQSRE